VAEPWETGPYGEAARAAIEERLTAVDAWTERYLELAAMAVDRRWVPTHCETHTANQLRTADGIILFVDWESLKLAPRERDLTTLVQAGYGDRVGADPAWSNSSTVNGGVRRSTRTRPGSLLGTRERRTTG